MTRTTGGAVSFVLRLILVAATLAVWEALVRLLDVPAFILPTPSNIFMALYRGIASTLYLNHIGITLAETLIGFVVGTMLAFALGIAVALSRSVEYFLYPFIVMFQAMPKVALAPLIIVWFGIGISSKIAIATIITFIVAVITALQGAREVDADLVKLLRSLGASRLKTWRTVIVPGAMPWIVAAFRLNVGFALIGAVVGEYIASKEGLGYMIYYAGVLYDLNAVWVGIATLMAVALLMYGAIDLIERRLLS